jgi:hypothetical protein
MCDKKPNRTEIHKNRCATIRWSKCSDVRHDVDDNECTNKWIKVLTPDVRFWTLSLVSTMASQSSLSLERDPTIWPRSVATTPSRARWVCSL